VALLWSLIATTTLALSILQRRTTKPQPSMGEGT
jgi:hypothetical protein